MTNRIIEAIRKYLRGETGAITVDLINLTVIVVGFGLFFEGTFFPSVVEAATTLAHDVTKGAELLHIGASPSVNTPQIINW